MKLGCQARRHGQLTHLVVPAPLVREGMGTPVSHPRGQAGRA